MIVKGIIKTIDFKGNTCTVRIPVLENSANGTEVVIPAVFSMIPGLYNGYKVGDVVFVAFENDQLNSPVVISKLYLGADTESKNPRGAINADSFKATNPITIPVSTKLTLDNDPNKLNTAKVKNGLADFKSISDIIKGLQVQTEQIGSLDVQLVDTGKELGAKVNKTQDAKTTGFGWNLTNDSWTLQAYNSSHGFKYTDILKATKNGVEVTGTIKIKDLPRYTRTTYAITDTKNSGDEPCPITTMPWYYIDDTRKYNDPENPPLAPWSLIEPEQTLGKYLWVATTVWSYTENTTTGELEESVDTTIQEGALLSYTYYYKQINKGSAAPDLPANNTIPTEESGWATAIPTRDNTKDIYRCAQVLEDDDDPEGIRHITYKDLNKIEDNALVLKQGKSANYYSDTDPHTLGYNIKYGDNWFDTGKSFVRVDKAKPEIKNANDGTVAGTIAGSFNTKDEYIDFHINRLKFKNEYRSDANILPYLNQVLVWRQGASPVGIIEELDSVILDTSLDFGNYAFACRLDFKDDQIPSIYLSANLHVDDGTGPDASNQNFPCYWECKPTPTGLPITPAVVETDTLYLIFKDSPLETETAFTKVDSSNMWAVFEKLTPAYAENQGVLKQWVGDHWEDIGGELIANKVTASYINALDITARRIHVLDNNNETLFLADGDTKKAEIAGFNVQAGEIITTDKEVGVDDTLLLLSSSGHQATISNLDNNPKTEDSHDWAIVAGKNFGVDTDGKLFAYAATLRDNVLFRPDIPIGLYDTYTFDPLKISTAQSRLGTITITCFSTFQVQELKVNHFSPGEIIEILDGSYTITDPSWGGGSGGGGSSGGGFNPGGGGGGIWITPIDPNSGSGGINGY